MNMQMMRGRSVVWGVKLCRIIHGQSGRDNSWHNGRDNLKKKWEKRNNESDRGYGRMTDGRGHFGSEYMNASYRGEAWQTNKNQRNWRGRKRTNKTYSLSMHDKSPSATLRWNSMFSCGPINRHGYVASGGA